MNLKVLKQTASLYFCFQDHIVILFFRTLTHISWIGLRDQFACIGIDECDVDVFGGFAVKYAVHSANVIEQDRWERVAQGQFISRILYGEIRIIRIMCDALEVRIELYFQKC